MTGFVIAKCVWSTVFQVVTESVSSCSIFKFEEQSKDKEVCRLLRLKRTHSAVLKKFNTCCDWSVIKNVVEREYINTGNANFTTSEIADSGLIKEVKHYEPAFAEIPNVVSNSTTITFPTAINTMVAS